MILLMKNKILPLQRLVKIHCSYNYNPYGYGNPYKITSTIYLVHEDVED